MSSYKEQEIKTNNGIAYNYTETVPNAELERVLDKGAGLLWKKFIMPSPGRKCSCNCNQWLVLGYDNRGGGWSSDLKTKLNTILQ